MLIPRPIKSIDKEKTKNIETKNIETKNIETKNIETKIFNELSTQCKPYEIHNIVADPRGRQSTEDRGREIRV